MGPLLLISGPSGSGKSTLIQRLLRLADPGLGAEGLKLRLSVSVTTRQPRPGEQDGVHYFFWGPQRFDEAVRRGEFLEHARVHDRCYGTLRNEVEGHREKGWGVILDIDIQGAEQVRPHCPDVVTFFIRTPSNEDYERRLRERGTETPETLERRLQSARRELSYLKDNPSLYRHVIVNDDLDRAYGELERLVRSTF